ncbi:hypothetical protein SLA2020_474500 [Shorea laevis]
MAPVISQLAILVGVAGGIPAKPYDITGIFIKGIHFFSGKILLNTIQEPARKLQRGTTIPSYGTSLRVQIAALDRSGPDNRSIKRHSEFRASPGAVRMECFNIADVIDARQHPPCNYKIHRTGNNGSHSWKTKGLVRN